MSSKPKALDRLLLGLVGILVTSGFLVFSSASLGLIARSGASFEVVALKQFLIGIVGGVGMMFIMSNIYYRNLRKYAFYIFGATLLLTFSVFVPGIGQTYNGATRWIDLGITSLQPAELLKIGFIIYTATWLSGTHSKLTSFKQGTLPFIGILAIVGFAMLLQPDTDTFAIMTFAGLAMYLTAGGSWKQILIMVSAGVVLIIVLALSYDHVRARLTTFLDPTSDPLGSSYQIHQSLIAVGSGGAFGRGFGQSIQKFEYLPEPTNDSIFAVFAEEFGFFGAVILLIMFGAFTLRGYRIATHARDLFGVLLVVGFITLIIAQAFLNIAAMVGLAPLSGLPLPFFSQGGTALVALLTSIGIVLNVSKYQVRSARS